MKNWVKGKIQATVSIWCQLTRIISSPTVDGWKNSYILHKWFSWLCNSSISDNFALLLELLQQWILHFRFLQKVNVTIDDHTLCKEKYGNYNIIVNDKMLCASDSGQDSCQGDSGGPLLKFGNDGKG